MSTSTHLNEEEQIARLMTLSNQQNEILQKNAKQLSTIAEVHRRQQEVLNALAEREELANEKQVQLLARIEDIENEMKISHHEHQENSNDQTMSKVGSAVAGFVVIALLATGVVVGFLKC
jgi:hypothetical protein